MSGKQGPKEILTAQPLIPPKAGRKHDRQGQRTVQPQKANPGRSEEKKKMQKVSTERALVQGMHLTADHKEIRLPLHRGFCGLHYYCVSVWSFFYYFMLDYFMLDYVGSNPRNETAESEMAETGEEGESTTDSYFIVGDDNK